MLCFLTDSVMQSLKLSDALGSVQKGCLWIMSLCLEQVALEGTGGELLQALQHMSSAARRWTSIGRRRAPQRKQGGLAPAAPTVPQCHFCVIPGGRQRTGEVVW